MNAFEKTGPRSLVKLGVEGQGSNYSSNNGRPMIHLNKMKSWVNEKNRNSDKKRSSHLRSCGEFRKAEKAQRNFGFFVHCRHSIMYTKTYLEMPSVIILIINIFPTLPLLWVLVPLNPTMESSGHEVVPVWRDISLQWVEVTVNTCNSVDLRIRERSTDLCMKTCL